MLVGEGRVSFRDVRACADLSDWLRIRNTQTLHQTLHKAQDSVIGGMAEYEIEDRRVRREQKIRLVNV